MRTYEIATKEGLKFVAASTRASAVYKLTRLTESAAKKTGMVISVRICK